MQSSKTSKKTRKVAEETVAAAPETGATSAEVKPTSRTSKSSSAKKEKASDTGRAKHRNVSAMETAVASHAVDSPVIDPVGVMTPAPEAQDVTHARISQLAYSYWIARGHAHGSPEEDWHRAERELKEKR